MILGMTKCDYTVTASQVLIIYCRLVSTLMVAEIANFQLAVSHHKDAATSPLQVTDPQESITACRLRTPRTEVAHREMEAAQEIRGLVTLWGVTGGL